MISDHMPSLIANSCSSTNRLIEKLKATIEHNNETIYLMPASSNTLKFSVYSEDDNTCNFVHITDNIITCQSGNCDSCYSTYKHQVRYLNTAVILCPHLTQMRLHADKWTHLISQTVDSNESMDCCGDEVEENIESHQQSYDSVLLLN